MPIMSTLTYLDYYSTQIRGPLFRQPLNANNATLNGITFVMRFEPEALALPTRAVTQMRVRFQAASITEGLIITNAYVHHAAAAGDAYDFLTTPIQLLFAGAANKTIAVGTEEWTDWAAFPYDKLTALLISFYIGGGTGSDSARERTGLTNLTRYLKVANDAATVNKTEYSTSAGSLMAINKIECDGY